MYRFVLLIVFAFLCACSSRYEDYSATDVLIDGNKIKLTVLTIEHIDAFFA